MRSKRLTTECGHLPHLAKGMCRNCYDKRYRMEHREYFREKQKRYHTKHREEIRMREKRRNSTMELTPEQNRRYEKIKGRIELYLSLLPAEQAEEIKYQMRLDGIEID
jgi:hypothetical protein